MNTRKEDSDIKERITMGDDVWYSGLVKITDDTEMGKLCQEVLVIILREELKRTWENWLEKMTVIYEVKHLIYCSEDGFLQPIIGVWSGFKALCSY